MAITRTPTTRTTPWTMMCERITDASDQGEPDGCEASPCCRTWDPQHTVVHHIARDFEAIEDLEDSEGLTPE